MCCRLNLSKIKIILFCILWMQMITRVTPYDFLIVLQFHVMCIFSLNVCNGELCHSSGRKHALFFSRFSQFKIWYSIFSLRYLLSHINSFSSKTLTHVSFCIMHVTNVHFFVLSFLLHRAAQGGAKKPLECNRSRS